MKIATFLSVMTFATGLLLGNAVPAIAHGPGMMGPGWGGGYGMGPGMMGPGWGGGYGMSPGMMGHGWGGGHGMGPGMMGHGWGGGYGMSPGMMGPGWGRGYGMGPGMMGEPLRQDLSADDVRHMMEHRLAWQGNDNAKLGKVTEKDKDTIEVEITDQDGKVVRRLEVNRHTGWMRPVR